MKILLNKHEKIIKTLEEKKTDEMEMAAQKIKERKEKEKTAQAEICLILISISNSAFQIEKIGLFNRTRSPDMFEFLTLRKLVLLLELGGCMQTNFRGAQELERARILS